MVGRQPMRCRRRGVRVSTFGKQRIQGLMVLTFVDASRAVKLVAMSALAMWSIRLDTIVEPAKEVCRGGAGALRLPSSGWLVPNLTGVPFQRRCGASRRGAWPESPCRTVRECAVFL